MKHLTIISHTEHYINRDGVIVGWGSTVTELNHLAILFDKITHVAMLHQSMAPASALPYLSEKIEFVALPAVGGQRAIDKLSIVTKMPKIIKIISSSLKSADYFQFRAPTGIGVFVIPYLILFTNKKGWFKYAGNWKQAHAPLAYQFQKWLLTHQSRPVTINGFWKDQPKQCISFENPCLTEEDIHNGTISIQKKELNYPVNFCFVGRLESAKGIDLIIEAIANLDNDQKKKIGIIHLVGDGERMSFYRDKVASMDVRFIFHGFLPRNDVQSIYKDSHSILLPSASEGFPKVIAEAMNYGCIPIVSNVSSIGHYINDGLNGFLLKQLTSVDLQNAIIRFLNLTDHHYSSMLHNYTDFVEPFTYTYYNRRLTEEIL